MLSTGGSSPLGPLAAPAWSPSRASGSAGTDAPSGGGRTASFQDVTPAFDGGAGFHVQKLVSPGADDRASPPRRAAVLAAYQTHLAGRVRYYGPLTPVDLRV